MPELESELFGHENGKKIERISTSAIDLLIIIEALKQCNGNQTKAAERLDTSLRIINYKIHNYGIEPKQYKVK